MGSLSKVQEQIVLGSILGDGYLRRKLNAHLEITHSVKQKEYVDWKYLFLKDIVITPPKAYKGNKGRVGYRFYTKSIPELTFFYNKRSLLHALHIINFTKMVERLYRKI